MIIKRALTSYNERRKKTIYEGGERNEMEKCQVKSTQHNLEVKICTFRVFVFW